MKTLIIINPLSGGQHRELADLEITVKMSGHQREGQGIRVKDIRIAAGGKGNFRFGSYFASGVEILSVEVKS